MRKEKKVINNVNIKAFIVFVFLLCVGCGEETVPKGAVATVNDKPIMLIDVVTAYEAAQGWGAVSSSLEELRDGYAATLRDLILQEMVVQYLAKNKMGITEEDLDEAERLAQERDPDETLQKRLLENAIEVEQWRYMERNTLALKRLEQQVLRPSVRVTVEEMNEYYTQNKAAFYIPAQIRFDLYSAFSKIDADRVQKDLAKEVQREDIEKTYPSVAVVRYTRDASLVHPLYEKSATPTEVGKPAGVVELNGQFHVFYLLEKIDESYLTVEQASKVIEGILYERKIDAAFEEWLKQEATQVKVKALPHLLNPLAEINYNELQHASELPTAGQATGASSEIPMAVHPEENMSLQTVPAQIVPPETIQ